MKKAIYALILPLLLVTVLVFAKREIKNEPVKQSTSRPLTAAEIKAELKKWEANPAGIYFRKWEASPEGKKVLAAAAKIRSQVSDSANMEAVVTALSLPPGSRLGFGLMVSIDGEDYILSFGAVKAEEFQQWQSLEIGDKIILRSHGVSYAPKYAYPIVAGNYVERDGKILFKRPPQNGGC